MNSKTNQFLHIPLAEAQTNTFMKTQQDALTSGRIIKEGKMIYSEITIQAAPEKVWRTFTDFKKYPEWNPFIRSLEGEAVKGNRIKARLQPPGKNVMVFKPVVLEFIPEKEFRWIGKLFLPRLFDGEHVFLIRANADGTTTFIQFERFRGILVPLLKKMLDENTLEGFHEMNRALKRLCEN